MRRLLRWGAWALGAPVVVLTVYGGGFFADAALHYDRVSRNVTIDGFGVGSRLDVSTDLPYLDCAYKLVEYAGRPRRKRSQGKASWPGRKQVFRNSRDGLMCGDVVSLDDDVPAGEPLIQQVMKNGKRIVDAEPLEICRERAARNLAQLPPQLQSLIGDDVG